jgi:hypothetical protein
MAMLYWGSRRRCCHESSINVIRKSKPQRSKTIYAHKCISIPWLYCLLWFRKNIPGTGMLKNLKNILSAAGPCWLGGRMQRGEVLIFIRISWLFLIYETRFGELKQTSSLLTKAVSYIADDVSAQQYFTQERQSSHPLRKV